MTESAENELLEPGNTELPPVPETLNIEPENAIIDDKPVQTFYKFGEDGFFLGRKCFSPAFVKSNCK